MAKTDYAKLDELIAEQGEHIALLERNAQHAIDSLAEASVRIAELESEIACLLCSDQQAVRAGVPWADVVAAAESKCAEIEARPRYAGEQHEALNSCVKATDQSSEAAAEGSPLERDVGQGPLL